MWQDCNVPKCNEITAKKCKNKKWKNYSRQRRYYRLQRRENEKAKRWTYVYDISRSASYA
ncbi:hypothetical protein JCM13267_04030 [Howardella ureilytica]